MARKPAAKKRSSRKRSSKKRFINKEGLGQGDPAGHQGSQEKDDRSQHAEGEEAAAEPDNV